MRIQNFMLLYLNIMKSACSVTAVRQFCGLPRKYQGCASFIYNVLSAYVQNNRTLESLTYIPVHSHPLLKVLKYRCG